jgi:hypothetical protein
MRPSRIAITEGLLAAKAPSMKVVLSCTTAGKKVFAADVAWAACHVEYRTEDSAVEGGGGSGKRQRVHHADLRFDPG